MRAFAPQKSEAQAKIRGIWQRPEPRFPSNHKADLVTRVQRTIGNQGLQKLLLATKDAANPRVPAPTAPRHGRTRVESVPRFQPPQRATMDAQARIIQRMPGQPEGEWELKIGDEFWTNHLVEPDDAEEQALTISVRRGFAKTSTTIIFNDDAKAKLRELHAQALASDRPTEPKISAQDFDLIEWADGRHSSFKGRIAYRCIWVNGYDDEAQKPTRYLFIHHLENSIANPTPIHPDSDYAKAIASVARGTFL